MIISVDTETTGKWDWKAPFDAPHQPRMVSLGIVAFSDDGEREVGCFYGIIRPEGFVINNDSEACKINGITQELAMECGIGLKTALGVLDQFCYRAHYIGMFNSQFDAMILEHENHILQRKHCVEKKKLRCLKIAYTGIVRKPPNPGFSDYAWPKLEEAYEFMYGVKPEGAHNAMADARNTAYLAFEAVKQGLWQFESEQLRDR
jgi:DNA polymerase III epsilon subunit-like protein